MKVTMETYGRLKRLSLSAVWRGVKTKRIPSTKQEDGSVVIEMPDADARGFVITPFGYDSVMFIESTTDITAQSEQIGKMMTALRGAGMKRPFAVIVPQSFDWSSAATTVLLRYMTDPSVNALALSANCSHAIAKMSSCDYDRLTYAMQVRDAFGVPLLIV